MQSKNACYIEIILSGIFAFILMSISLYVNAYNDCPSMEDRLSRNEFRQAGLEKLTQEELAALNESIRVHLCRREESENGNSVSGEHFDNQQEPSRRLRQGLPDSRDKAQPVDSVVAGSFTGWRGNTTFELENGMLWVQAEPGLLSVSPRENQRIIIEPGFLSSWYLRIDGINKRLRVKRIR